MDKYVILNVEGGIGKNVIATAVVRAISNKWKDRKLIILTAHPDIWFCNPRVDRVLQFGMTPYFYQDYVDGKDSILLMQDPYRCEDYIYRRKHLSEVWCDMFGIKWDGEKPELYFTTLEFDFLSTLIKNELPIFLIQPFGGSQGQQHKYSWARDIPPVIAQTIVDEMIKKGYRVIQIRREDQIGLNNSESLSLNPRQLALSLMLSDKRLLIDSYMQHAAAALGLQSTVLWIGNSPKVFGYELHNNISADFEPGFLRSSLYDPYDITGDPIQLVTPPNNLFSVEQILESLKDGNGPSI
jgi:hypothetical protein